MTSGGYVVGPSRAHTGPGMGVETALARAMKSASRAGEMVVVYRASDSAAIASVWPDGKIDLTEEGSLVA